VRPRTPRVRTPSFLFGSGRRRSSPSTGDRGAV
jgi:hypothetical protein